MDIKAGMLRYADTIDRILLVFGILSCIGVGMMSPLTMLVLSEVINSFGSSNTDTNLAIHVVNKYALKLLYIAIGGGISGFIEGVTWTRTAERQTSRMRMEYLKSVLRQEVGYFDEEADSSTTFKVISSISTDAILIQEVIADKIPSTLAYLADFIFSLIVAFTLSWRIALAGPPMTLLFIIPVTIIGTLMMTQGIKMKDADGVAGGIMEQAISSIRTVYSYVGERQTLDNFNQALQKYADLGVRQGLTKGLIVGSMATIFAAWAGVAWIGSILVTEKGEKGGPVFIAGTVVIVAGINTVKALPNISFFADAKAAALRISEVTDRTPTIDSTEQKGEIIDHVRGEIEFKEVDFSYPSRPDTKVLQGFNLKVQAGETVGLVGSSGSGKSTVISLIERFYDPDKGEILLDGFQITRLQLKWLRSKIGLVSQEPILFATSIKENILFGMDGASMELVTNAAKAANADNFITKLPEGYNTQVGPLGVQLSGGQKQRIAIARALIRDPRILLLDEATSALDAESERLVQGALEQASQGRTTVVVAHRLTTIQNADTIMVLQSGKVIESGTHNELTQMKDGEGGTYLQMVQLHQIAMQNKGKYPSSYSAGSTSHRRLNSNPSIRTSFGSRSSMDSSPPFYSPALSFSELQSSEMDLYDENSNKSSNNPSPQWRLLKMNAPEWKNSMLGCLGAAGFGAIQPLVGYSIASLIMVFLLNDNSKIKSETRFYIVMFMSLAVIHFITSFLHHYNFAVMGEALTKRVREKVVANILTFEVGWFDKDENTSAAICARISAESKIVRSLTGDRMSLLVEVFTNASLSYALALATSWRLSIVLVSLQPLIIASFYLKAFILKSANQRAKKAQNEGCTIASEAALNHRTVTAFSSQERILGLFEVAMEGPKKDSIRHSWISGFGLCSSQFFTGAFVCITFWYGGRLLNQKSLALKSLFQVFFVLMNMGKTIAEAGGMVSDLTKGATAVGSLFAVIDRKTEIAPEDPAGIEIEKGLKGDIELKNVYFSYPSRPDQMILQGLYLKIKAGKTMALVGQSGSGKSTVIGLIERFYDPVKGRILIDGYDIKSYNLRSLRSHIALVSQEPTLFAGTIRQNILYGKEDASEHELREASSLANATEFISSLTDGYDTHCGERGVQLSGGQKQRIALARAILKNPAILLLDEATSALDSVSENLLQVALDKLMVGRTCVVIAHKLSTIQKSDCIAVINNGKVVEQGTHSDLLSEGNGGSYYSLMKLQISGTPSSEPKPKDM